MTIDGVYDDDFETPIEIHSSSVDKKPSKRTSVASKSVRVSRTSKTTKEHVVTSPGDPIEEIVEEELGEKPVGKNASDSGRPSQLSKKLRQHEKKAENTMRQSNTSDQLAGEKLKNPKALKANGRAKQARAKVSKIEKNGDIVGESIAGSKKSTEEEELDTAWKWKHYHTFLPVTNKLLAKKWDDITREIHLKKLANIKKSVDDRPPPKYIHLKANLKRAQMEQERHVMIKRNNRILIEKMTDITKQEHLIENSQEHDARVELFNRGHEHSRKLINDRIHQENLAILQRLECSKSDYDHIKVKNESKIRLHHLQNLACFPQKYIKLIKEEVERKILKETSTKSDANSSNGHQHDRHHWHGAYGGKPVPHALDMSAYPGEEVAAFSKKYKTERVGVAEVDRQAFVKGSTKKQQRAVPPIMEGSGPLVRENSPINA